MIEADEEQRIAGFEEAGLDGSAAPVDADVRRDPGEFDGGRRKRVLVKIVGE